MPNPYTLLSNPNKIIWYKYFTDPGYVQPLKLKFY
jgi:hypothetical protein